MYSGIVRAKSIWQFMVTSARFLLWTVFLLKNCHFLKSINTVTVMQLVWASFFVSLCFWVITNFFFKIMKSYFFFDSLSFAIWKENVKPGYLKEAKSILQQFSDFLGDRKYVAGDKVIIFRKEKHQLILYYHSLCVPHLKLSLIHIWRCRRS